jgi:hypothetical protein
VAKDVKRTTVGNIHEASSKKLAPNFDGYTRKIFYKSKLVFKLVFDGLTSGHFSTGINLTVNPDKNNISM